MKKAAAAPAAAATRPLAETIPAPLEPLDEAAEVADELADRVELPPEAAVEEAPAAVDDESLSLSLSEELEELDELALDEESRQSLDWP